MIHEVKTWQDVLEALQKLTPEQLAQPAQFCNPTPDMDEVQEMLQGIAIGTVAELEFQACRSTHNNKYCPDDVVLLMDGNPFAKDGAYAYEWKDDGSEVPIYGKDGPTDPEDQKCGPSKPWPANVTLSALRSASNYEEQ